MLTNKNTNVLSFIKINFGGSKIKTKNKFIIFCLLTLVIFSMGVSFASADVDDNMQSNDNLTEVSDAVSASGVAEEDNLMNSESEVDVLNSSSDNEVLKATDVMYISPNGAGDGSDSDHPSN